MTTAVQECIWLQQLLQNIGYEQKQTIIHEDNVSCIALAKNPQEKTRTRHIKVKYHWIRDQLQNGIFKFQAVPTDQQDADIFTKGMHGPQLRSICSRLGLSSKNSEKQGES